MQLEEKKWGGRSCEGTFGPWAQQLEPCHLSPQKYTLGLHVRSGPSFAFCSVPVLLPCVVVTVIEFLKKNVCSHALPFVATGSQED